MRISNYLEKGRKCVDHKRIDGAADFGACDLFQFTEVRRAVGIFIVHIFGCKIFSILIAWLTFLGMPGFGLDSYWIIENRSITSSSITVSGHGKVLTLFTKFSYAREYCLSVLSFTLDLVM